MAVRTTKSQATTGAPSAASPQHSSPRGAHSALRVIGVGASAGGLAAFEALLDRLPPTSGMAFILVQHLDPSHKSMMTRLLSTHTSMTVREAANGMILEPDHVYVIPPGTYLSVLGGRLLLSPQSVRRGARLPFDWLLQSLAKEYRKSAVCVVLSGTGNDGSTGLIAVKEKGGLVIAQQPEEAAFDGMPRSAILTGAVDLVLPLAKIPEALIDYARQSIDARSNDFPERPKTEPEWLAKTIDVLRSNAGHDFSSYKPGMLKRRIARRMAIAGGDAQSYLEKLQAEEGELQSLANDLLINVTNFFRDPGVFDFIAATVVSGLIAKTAASSPLRIWVPGCSTGEEAYSLAMLFLEQIESKKFDTRVQIFASDVDPDAIEFARQGLYPPAIERDLSEARINRFFVKEDGQYRVSPELRATILFTVHDVLADPPFSRLDMISCRNLMIYLSAEAQATVISRFDFGLKDGGFLILGTSETVAASDVNFELISRSDRVYRHHGRSKNRDPAFAVRPPPELSMQRSRQSLPAASQQTAFAELCQQLVMDSFAPATVLINREYECLFYLGPINNYLKVPLGKPVHDLFSKTREGVANKLRWVIERAYHEHARVAVSDGCLQLNGTMCSFGIVAQPVSHNGLELMMISFVDQPERRNSEAISPGSPASPQISRLEQELDTTKSELESVIRSLEAAGEARQAVNDQLSRFNEEFQLANEDLLTSKEELQSLNEELSSLNAQLQQTLQMSQKTADDLQNVLTSTDVATLFLDTDLNIRLFTPATRSMFHIIPSDIGRPISDLSSLDHIIDGLKADAEVVLKTGKPLEREVQSGDSTWFFRRIMPYKDQTNLTKGVVLTFSDVTAQKKASEATEAAKLRAEIADMAKSRFLAVASHDLRQPLQTLELLHTMLVKAAQGEKARQMLARFGETLRSMSGILNALLDINQIEAGTIPVDAATFPINTLLEKLRNEFSYSAHEKGLALHVVNCRLHVHSDPRLLEQIVRNLLSNAIKYTKHGKIVLGCRRRGEKLSVEVGDTGLGVPASEHQTIFSEYYQLDNPARDDNRGFGLGLSIVQRLAALLKHKVTVRSHPGKGSIFAIEVNRASHESDRPSQLELINTGNGPDRASRLSVILIVEDDDSVRELLKLHLDDEGYRTATASDGNEALNLIRNEAIRPDLILADLNLPNGMDGLAVVARLREQFRRPIPVIVLTGDISTDSLRRVALQDCLQFNKPVNVDALTQAIQRLLPISKSAADTVDQLSIEPAGSTRPSTVYVIDDDPHVLPSMRALLEEDGLNVRTFASCEEFQKVYVTGGRTCLLLDAYLPGMTGLELLKQLRETGDPIPAIVITGRSEVDLAVQAMKAGACDFIEKPASGDELLSSIRRALEPSADLYEQVARQEAAGIIAGLTPRQREVLDLILAGHPNKSIAANLGINQRTVEGHRAEIMKKTRSKSLPSLARLALTAAGGAAPKVSRT